MTARRSTPRRLRRWTAQLADQVAIANNAIFSTNIVAVADYALSPNLSPSGATLVRLRGKICLNATTLATVQTVWLAIVNVDQDIAAVLGGVLDPSVVANLIDEDVLWWETALLSTTFVEHQMAEIYLDIKAQRKLKDTDVRLVVRGTNGAAGVIGSITLNVRALLIGDSS